MSLDEPGQKEQFFKAYLRLKLSGKSRKKVISILSEYDQPVEYDRSENCWRVRSFSDDTTIHQVLYYTKKKAYQCDCQSHFFAPYDPEVDYKEMCIHIHLVVLYEKCFK